MNTLLDPNVMAALRQRALPAARTTAKGKKTYTITDEWLEQHDAQIRKDLMKRKQDELKAYARRVIEEDFDERQKLLDGSDNEVLAKIIALTISIPAKILVRDFGWKPVKDKTQYMNMKLNRFGAAFEEEINMILDNALFDIRHYADQVYEETGLGASVNEEEIE